MFTKILTISVIILILVSLFTALYQLTKKDAAPKGHVARALTVRISLSVCLFILLLAGFHFGIIAPHGMR